MKKLFVTVLIIRLLLMLLPSFQIDMTGWRFWAMRMVELGPAQFYSPTIFTDNPPGYLYVFWVIGEIWSQLGDLGGLGVLGGNVFEWLLKLPGNLFDLGTGFLIYRILREKGLGRLSYLGFLGYTLNPAIWFNSSVFGQFDGAGAFFSLLAVYWLVEKKQWGWAGVALAVSWSIKPQAIFVALAIGILALRLLKLPGMLKLAGAFLLTTLLLYLPFFPENPLAGVFYVQQRMTQIYSCTTCFTFNFWGLWGNWQNDNLLFLNIPLLWWGIGLTGTSLLVTLLSPLRHSGKREKRAHPESKWDGFWTSQNDETGYGRVYLAIALSIMVCFTFLTRMHERYLLAMFPFLLISAILLKSRFLMLFYILMSALNLLNVYYPYAYYNKELNLTPWLVVWLGENFKLLSGVGIGCFLILLWWCFTEKKWEAGGEKWETEVKMPSLRGALATKQSLCNNQTIEQSNNSFSLRLPRPAPERCGARNDITWSKKETILIIFLVFVSFFIRVIRLDIPKTYYFDEVYHAFTAVELERGNKMAWEWWNTPPQDFAYEWTHPALAKEIMIGGIRGIRWIRGISGIELSDAFGWRLPGVILGTGVIFLIYLLGRNLFNKRVGFIAAFLASCDGLLFTQSRIGMNDIYFLFFMLLAFYFFLKFLKSQKKKNTLLNVHVHTRQGIFFLLEMGVSLGLALASKWTAIYGIGILGGIYAIRIIRSISNISLIKKEIIKFFLSFLIIPLAVYLITYIPFFTSGHNWSQFNELQHQMWWYHTRLKATHPFTSPWFSWPFDWRPVWYYVEYGEQTIANIYAMGNPLVWWGGIAAIGFVIWKLLRSTAQFLRLAGPVARSSRPTCSPSAARARRDTLHSRHPLVIILLGYFGFFLPWALSPRIMFLYHYLPSVAFMCLGLGWGLERISRLGVLGSLGALRITGKLLTFGFLLLTLLVFVYFYPHWSALAVPKWLDESYYWFGSWR